MRNSDDAFFLRNIPLGILEDFRNTKYTETYFQDNKVKFSTTDWVDLEELKQFLQRQKASNTHVKCDPNDASDLANMPTEHEHDAFNSASTAIKRERSTSPHIFVKKEHEDSYFEPSGNQYQSVHFRTLVENGNEVIELLSSDSESEMEVDISSDTLVPDQNESDDESDVTDLHSDAEMSDGEVDSAPQPSDTVWLDPEISSNISRGPHQLHRQLTVESIEYLHGLPSYFPIPRDKRAYLINLSSSAFDIRDKDGKLLPVDVLIKDAEQDSWRGCTGTSDSHPKLSVFTGEPVPCRRSRLQCAGCYACERINPDLVSQLRWELDPNSLEKVVNAQIESRVAEADTPEKHALIFFIICHSAPCTAVNPANGQTCNGVPKMQHFRDNKRQKGKHSFISCTGYSGSFTDGHRTASIPPSVNEDHIKTLFSGHPLPGFENPSTCSRIVSAHVGGRVKTCRYVLTGTRSQDSMEHHPCPASRTIFVPLNSEIRQCLIVPNPDKPHNHPILPASKASKIIQGIYVKCIEAAGLVGSTVRKVDNAKSTQLILNKKIPSLIAPALQNSRLKQDLVRQQKKKEYPCGTGIAGVINLMDQEQKKPITERYIHVFTRLPDGRMIIVTANPFLLSLIHNAITIQVDTTFKRAVGELDEWEVVMWDRASHRAVTIARIYSNRTDRVQYKQIFDDLQSATLEVTGRRLLLKRLSPNGTLISIGVDLELSQALGAGDSFLPTNVPSFSGIPASIAAEELIEYFIRACVGHAKRGIMNLKGSVTADQFHKINEFFYLETPAEVEQFSTWIKRLGVKKVTDWWNHKEVNSWIKPSLIKCLSKIDPADWDITPATTNLNESQHAWTNLHTGTKLSLLEAILTARELDEKTAHEIQASLMTGVLKNRRNDTFTRMSNNTTRANNASRKVRETRQRDDALQNIKHDIETLAFVQKKNAARMKVLKATKANIATRKPRAASSEKAQSSSSGRVYTTSRSRVKVAAKVDKKKKEISTSNQKRHHHGDGTAAVELVEDTRMTEDENGNAGQSQSLPGTTAAPVQVSTATTYMAVIEPAASEPLPTPHPSEVSDSSMFAEVTGDINLFAQAHTTAATNSTSNTSCFMSSTSTMPNAEDIQNIPGNEYLGLQARQTSAAVGYWSGHGGYSAPTDQGFLQMLYSDSYNEFDSFLGSVNGL